MANYTKEQIEAARGTTVITVVHQDEYDDPNETVHISNSDRPGSLRGIISDLTAVWENIPAKYRNEATCEITSESESSLIKVVIAYSVPETDEEVAARLDQQEQDRIFRIRQAESRVWQAQYDLQRIRGGEFY